MAEIWVITEHDFLGKLKSKTDKSTGMGSVRVADAKRFPCGRLTLRRSRCRKADEYIVEEFI